MDLYYKHIQDKRTIQINTPEYDDWLEKLLTFDISNVKDEHLWVNCDLYYLYMAKQGTQSWKNARMSRITGSVLSDACGRSKYSNTDIKNEHTIDNKGILIDLYKVSEEINGIREKKFSDFAINVAMKHGSITEPYIRELHSKMTNRTILELPLAVPRDNFNIGVSIDAYIKNDIGIGEYKAPQRLYISLKEHMDMINICKEKNLEYEKTYEHIITNHYYQMHLGMNIFNKSFCDYVVYDNVRTNSCYIERIPFNTKLWENEISKQLNYFMENYLLPLRNKHNIIPLNPPRQV